MRNASPGFGRGSPPRGGRLIVTADDFGRAPDINAAVLAAHRDGILTSASLMVTGEAFDQAVALAHETPSLAVGLHLVLVDGRSALPPGGIPHLVDASGRFLRDPVRAGLRYFFSRAARRELARELEAQFERFAATGIPLSHVDGHLHMHLHPTVFRMVLPLARRYGARGIRVPRDRWALALRRDRKHALKKAAWGAIFSLVSRWCRKQMKRDPLPVAARTYGLMQTGGMHEAYVLDVLRRMREPSAEMYFHPTTGARLDEFGPNPDDFASLISPTIRRVVEEREFELTTYPGLASAGEYGARNRLPDAPCFAHESAQPVRSRQ